MSRWEKRLLLLLPSVAVVMYVAGDISMSRYGLDPPYIYFEAGAWLKLTSFAIAAMAVVFAVLVGIRYIIKTRRRIEPNA